MHSTHLVSPAALACTVHI